MNLNIYKTVFMVNLTGKLFVCIKHIKQKSEFNRIEDLQKKRKKERKARK